MAKVKIFLEPHETKANVEDLLFKALQSHRSGTQHKDDFQQPVAREVSRKLISEHDKMFKKMLKEISTIIDGDVYGGG